MLFRLYIYDAWGNDKDGYTVNDCFRTLHTFNIDDCITDRDMFTLLKSRNVLSRTAKLKCLVFDWVDDSLLAVYHKTEPLFELRLDSETKPEVPWAKIKDKKLNKFE